ncbi:metal-dependent hydrolase [Candidatus Nanopelagicaceae bacterium]
MSQALENFQRRTAEFLDALALIPDRLRNTAPEGEWSAAFIVHHVSDAELHFATRYLSTLASDNPTMVYFDEELYPDALRYQKRNITKSLASISGVRAMVLDVLSHMDESALQRITTSEDGKVRTLGELLELADGHMASHTEQLKELHSKIS